MTGHSAGAARARASRAGTASRFVVLSGSSSQFLLKPDDGRPCPETRNGDAATNGDGPAVLTEDGLVRITRPESSPRGTLIVTILSAHDDATYMQT